MKTSGRTVLDLTVLEGVTGTFEGPGLNKGEGEIGEGLTDVELGETA
jgi:hypothetical protein